MKKKILISLIAVSVITASIFAYNKTGNTVLAEKTTVSSNNSMYANKDTDKKDIVKSMFANENSDSNKSTKEVKVNTELVSNDKKDNQQIKVNKTQSIGNTSVDTTKIDDSINYLEKQLINEPINTNEKEQLKLQQSSGQTLKVSQAKAQPKPKAKTKPQPKPQPSDSGKVGTAPAKPSTQHVGRSSTGCPAGMISALPYKAATFKNGKTNERLVLSINPKCDNADLQTLISNKNTFYLIAPNGNRMNVVIDILNIGNSTYIIFNSNMNTWFLQSSSYELGISNPDAIPFDILMIIDGMELVAPSK